MYYLPKCEEWHHTKCDHQLNHEDTEDLKTELHFDMFIWLWYMWISTLRWASEVRRVKCHMHNVDASKEAFQNLYQYINNAWMADLWDSKHETKNSNTFSLFWWTCDEHSCPPSSSHSSHQSYCWSWDQRRARTCPQHKDLNIPDLEEYTEWGKTTKLS